MGFHWSGKGNDLLKRTAVVKAPVGLHARPAAAFVRAATETGFPVVITRAGRPGVDARSLLQVMSADFESGCEVEISVDESALEGPLDRQAAEKALEDLGELLEAQGGE